jgi:hypothetical protein
VHVQNTHGALDEIDKCVEIDEKRINHSNRGEIGSVLFCLLEFTRHESQWYTLRSFKSRKEERLVFATGDLTQSYHKTAAYGFRRWHVVALLQHLSLRHSKHSF